MEESWNKLEDNYGILLTRVEDHITELNILAQKIR